MGNCLVTKLKESVQNNNLEKLGSFLINVAYVENLGSDLNRAVLFNSTDTVTVTVKSGSGHIGKTADDCTHTSLEYEGTSNPNVNNPIYFENSAAAGDYVVEVTPKYNFIRLTSRGTLVANFGVDLNSLEYSNLSAFQCAGQLNTGSIESLKDVPGIYIYNADISGSIDVFNGKTIGGATSSTPSFAISSCRDITGNIRSLRGVSVGLMIDGTSISGDIANFTPSNIESLSIVNTNVEGTIESFATALSATYRSRSVTVNARGSKVTYNGSVPTTSLTITFDASGNYTIS